MRSSDEITNDVIQALYKEWDMKNKDEEIVNRVSNIFRDWRLAFLIKEYEMFNLLSKIEYELDSKKASDYLDVLEFHIPYVDPHVEIVTINDEDVPVFFLTKNLGGAE